jgi:hypothetical protein
MTRYTIKSYDNFMQVARCHDYFVTHNIAFTQTYQLSRSAFHGEKSISSLTFRPDDCRARCKISLIHRRSHDLSRRSLSLRLKISRFWSFRMSVVTQRSDSLCDTHPRQLLWHSEHESIIPFLEQCQLSVDVAVISSVGIQPTLISNSATGISGNIRNNCS